MWKQGLAREGASLSTLRKVAIVFLCYLGIGFGGCGYTFAGSTTSLPKGVERIYVPIVQNDSTETSLTSLMTEAIRDRLGRYGVVEVVESLSEADAVLEVRVVKVKKSTAASDSTTDTALQQSFAVTLFGELKKSDGEVLWRDPGLVVSKSFAVSTSTVVASSPTFALGNLTSNQLGNLNARELSRGQEYSALVQVSEVAARNIYDAAIAADF